MVNSGVKTPLDCQEICLQTSLCSHFTWQEGNYCYLVDSPNWLEHDNDKISGSRDCVQFSDEQEATTYKPEVCEFTRHASTTPQAEPETTDYESNPYESDYYDPLPRSG